MSLRHVTRWMPAFVLAALLLTVAGVATAQPPEQPPAVTVPIGTARIDITPDYPIRMAGYASRKTESEGIAGRLWAKALAIGGDEGEGPAVLVIVDNCQLPTFALPGVAARLKAKAGVEPERFMVCCTHVHSGPRLPKSPPPEDLDSLSPEQRRTAQYAGQLIGWIEQVALEALASRKPGRLAWTRGSVPFAGNRRTLTDGKWTGFGRYPDGPVDHTLLVMRAVDAEGKPLAVLVNYACHCTTLRGNFMQIHGDWGGCAQACIEADHPGATAMVSIGCGADADPYPHGTVELAERHGRAVADEVKRLLAGPLEPISPGLTARTTYLEVPFEKPPGEEKPGAEPDDSPPRQPPESLRYPIGTWVFGDELAMVFLAGEVVVDYARRLKRELDGPRLWINAYANDVPCYVVSKRLLDEGGYEVRNSISSRVTHGNPQRLAPAMEDRITAAVRTLLPPDFQSPASGTLPPPD